VTDDTRSSGLPGFGFTVAIVGLVAGALLAHRRSA